MSSTLDSVQQRTLEQDSQHSGIYLLSDPHDAFAARVQLADAAEHTLDLQYYIWANDTAGRILLSALCRAAKRGVNVRLLLDDYGSLGADELFCAMDMHPRIEVRLFNPLVSRRLKWTGYVSSFFRIHRRMHNKSFTADNRITIVGGRNIGNAYFGGNGDNSFVDLDALAVGPVAREVTADFERYWHSPISYPADNFLPAISNEEQQQLLSGLDQDTESATTLRYKQAIDSTTVIDDILTKREALTWASVIMVSDDPTKVIEKTKKDRMMSQQLAVALGEPQHRFTLVSPYFIPMKSGVALLSNMAAKGIKVSVLTNSLSVNDMRLAHVGYSKYRLALIKAGIELFEMRSTSKAHTGTNKRKPSARKPLRKKIFSRKGSSGKKGIMGNKGSSLHAKTFAVDSQKLFVGSFNFDPRSTRLNTELGFVIESPELATQLESYFDTVASETCYRLSLSRLGHLRWTEQIGGDILRYRHEPGTNLWTRLVNRFYAMLPIEPFL